MDRTVIRYSVAAAAILVAVTIAVSAMAESGQYQPPSRPVDPNARLPGVIRLEQFLNRNGVTGLNNVKGQPAQPTAQPTAQPAAAQPAPVTAQPQVETVTQAPPVSNASSTSIAVPPRREAIAAPANPPMIKIATPAFEDEPVAADGVPVQDASVLYAPPVRAPWWERLLASRAFLYAAIFGLIVVPVCALAGSAVLGRRREERDLMLYD